MKRKKSVSSIDVYTGQKIREARLSRKLNQEKLGQLLTTPITSQQIQKYECGVNRISAARLWEMALVLNVPMEYFLPSENEDINRSNELLILRYFRDLSPEKQNALIILLTD